MEIHLRETFPLIWFCCSEIFAMRLKLVPHILLFMDQIKWFELLLFCFVYLSKFAKFKIFFLFFCLSLFSHITKTILSKCINNVSYEEIIVLYLIFLKKLILFLLEKGKQKLIWFITHCTNIHRHKHKMKNHEFSFEYL